MGYVNFTTGQFSQQDVSGYYYFFGTTWNCL